MSLKTGGLIAGFGLKNTNGICLIAASLNSLLNSHEIMKYLYALTPITTSLNKEFKDIVLTEKETVLIQLLSAYVHDYITSVENPDLDKIMFVIKNLKNIVLIKTLPQLLNQLDKNYKKFSHSRLFKLDTFNYLIIIFFTHN